MGDCRRIDPTPLPSSVTPVKQNAPPMFWRGALVSVPYSTGLHAGQLSLLNATPHGSPLVSPCCFRTSLAKGDGLITPLRLQSSHCQYTPPAATIAACSLTSASHSVHSPLGTLALSSIGSISPRVPPHLSHLCRCAPIVIVSHAAQRKLRSHLPSRIKPFSLPHLTHTVRRGFTPFSG